MSAICGIYHIDGRPVSAEIGYAMMDKFSIYPSDVAETWYRGEVFVGCFAQHITVESTREKLPYFDSEAGLSITADAIIDNRKELFKLLDIPTYEWGDISDSQLILLSYKKWGEECPKYLVGDFAFTIWNIKKKEIFCARDHVGKRTFYYHYYNNLFAFSTAIKPLFAIPEIKKMVNDCWIADFLSIESVIHEFDCSQTIYEGIQQLPPAHTLVINKKGMIKKQYWFPLEVPKLKLKSDEEYEEAFREVFFEAVSCRLRSIGAIGIMLSGGLDSSSVACIAARQLGVKGETLHGFSAVPLIGYKDWLPKGVIADESPYIEDLRKHIKNLELIYCRSEGKHSLTNIKGIMKVLEQPYKIIDNYFWVDEIAAIAAKNKCKVLLDGQYGNLTISFGDFFIQTTTLFKQGKLLALLREIKGYSEFYNIKTLRVERAVAKYIIPWVNKKNIYKIRREEAIETMVPVNKKLAQHWKVEERFRKGGYDLYSKLNRDLAEARSLTVKPEFFSHIGAIDSKMSLNYGLVKRDPTRDKRVIEFCLSIPGDQYVRDGRERYLIRRAMKGILPDKICQNYDTRGRQSADCLQRLLPFWQDIKNELLEMLQMECLQRYIDVPKLRRALNDIGDLPRQESWMTLRMLLICLNLGYFLKEFENE